MHVFYTCDNNYVWLMGISLISLLENNRKIKDLNVYLLGDKISDENKEILNGIGRKYKRNITVIDVDVKDLGLPKTIAASRWPTSAYIRLYADHFLPKNIKKALYLDCDTIIMKNLSDLFNTDMKGAMVCGVRDCVSGLYKKNIGLDKDSDYINAGVLLMDIEKFRRTDVGDMITDFLDKYAKSLSYADQDILNGIFLGKIRILKPKYNANTMPVVCTYKEIKQLRRFTAYYSERELEGLALDPAIIHYTTFLSIIRPWFRNANHPMTEEFRKYMDMSPWKDRELVDFVFNSNERKVIRFVEKLPKPLAYRILGRIHAIARPFVKSLKKQDKI